MIKFFFFVGNERFLRPISISMPNLLNGAPLRALPRPPDPMPAAPPTPTP